MAVFETGNRGLKGFDHLPALTAIQSVIYRGGFYIYDGLTSACIMPIIKIPSL